MRTALVLLLLPALSGCATAEYYWQGIRGEFDILERAQPVPAVIETTSDATLKRKLERSAAIRDYASRELALPDNGSYRSYAEIGRRFVLWNVIATPELSLEPRQWCFPIAGCVNYRGYFEEAAAKGEAAKFTAAGDDVHVSGVPAFSTLGYFNDPILSTFIRYPDPELARLVFHELAHQVAYAKDDSVFNESFAVLVEEVGVERWLAAQNDPALAAQFASSQRYREGFRDLVGRTRSAPRSVVCQRCERRSQARRQGGRLRADAHRVCRPQGAVGRLRGVRRLVRARAHQCQSGGRGSLLAEGAGVPCLAHGGRRQPAALLRPGKGARAHAQGGARTHIGCRRGVDPTRQGRSDGLHP